MKELITRIAIQKEGRLFEESISYLKKKGLIFPEKQGRQLIVQAKKAPVEILLVRHGDIPRFVELGVAQFGIVGENKLLEKKYAIKIVKKLGFGKCSLVIAVPKKYDKKKISQLNNERFATSYPQILRNYLRKNNTSASIIELAGSVEVATKLNLADAICDITQTGQTLKENDLVKIADVQKFEAVLIKHPENNKNEHLIL